MSLWRWFRSWFFICLHDWVIVGGFFTPDTTHDVFECTRCGKRESVARVVHTLHD